VTLPYAAAFLVALFPLPLVEFSVAPLESALSFSLAVLVAA